MSNAILNQSKVRKLIRLLSQNYSVRRGTQFIERVCGYCVKGSTRLLRVLCKLLLSKTLVGQVCSRRPDWVNQLLGLFCVGRICWLHVLVRRLSSRHSEDKITVGAEWHISQIPYACARWWRHKMHSNDLLKSRSHGLLGRLYCLCV